MRSARVCAFVLAALAAAPAPGAAQGSVRSWQPVADLLVRRMALRRGERVLLVGQAGLADSLVPRLRAAITRSGGTWLGAVAVRGTWPAAWGSPFTTRLAAASGVAREELVAQVDLGVMLPGATPNDALYAELQHRLRRGAGRTIHFHWAGAYRMDGTPFDPTPAVDALYRRALLTTNYAALAARQRAFEQAMRGGVVRVTTPAGTDISFRIGDRPVTRQDGDAAARRAAGARNLIDREVELPAGAVRVAPMESTVDGTIVFPPGVWGGERVELAVMRLRLGKVEMFEANRGRPAVQRELTAGGAAAQSFREFALGFNPLLAIREDDGQRWIPYYGYGAGVVRLSLGDNTELGGAVGGGYVRWNFFTDATVTVGGTTWVKDGKLVR